MSNFEIIILYKNLEIPGFILIVLTFFIIHEFQKDILILNPSVNHKIRSVMFFNLFPQAAAKVSFKKSVAIKDCY